MAVTAEQSAPYAPSSVILGLLERNREKGLPNPITADVLQRLSVSDSLVQRSLQALKILDLVGEDGKHTATLESLRRVPEAEYKTLMAQWLKAAYEHVLDVIDPATADEVSIRDAFRLYNPQSLQPRMITLFTSLFEAAGVRAVDTKTPAAKKSPRPSASPRIAKPAVRPPVQRRTEHSPPAPAAPEGMDPALAGMLARLPRPGSGWTQGERDSFYTTFGVVLDFCFPIREASSATPEAHGDADGEV